MFFLMTCVSIILYSFVMLASLVSISVHSMFVVDVVMCVFGNETYVYHVVV